MSSDPAALHDYAVQTSREVYRGKLFGLRRDEVVMPGGRIAVREVLVHPGAVVVAALDEADRIVVVQQFRHPVRRRLWELPAGLLDVAGEPAVDGARRELAEEAGLRAATWHTLLDLSTSPGITTEILRVFLARDLTDVPAAERYHPEDDEESEITVDRIELDRAVTMTFAGTLENAATAAAVLATARARDTGWRGLRPADAPWPARDQQQARH